MRFPLKHNGVIRGFKNTGLKVNRHYGVDFGWNSKYGGKNAPIYAIADGEVIYIKKQITGGKTIRIKHYNEKDAKGNVFCSEYGHLSSIKVKVGQRVKMGDMIANMGKTGIATAEHLHLTIYKGSYCNANKVDPLKYLCLYKDQSTNSSTQKDYTIHKTKIVNGTDGYLAIRNKPSTDGKIICKAKEGSQVESFGVKKGWNIVDNINGYYCSNKYLK